MSNVFRLFQAEDIYRPSTGDLLGYLAGGITSSASLVTQTSLIMCLKLTILFATVILFIVRVNAVPYKSRHEPASLKNCSDSDSDESPSLIDQTQKGKENYRINVKDFVLVWAPSDILLTAAALFDSQILGGELFGSGSNEDTEEALLANKPSQNSSEIVDSNVNSGDKVTINSAQKSKMSKFRFPALVNNGKKS